MKIGFSTGSLAYSDFRQGLRIATNPQIKAIELSALREKELEPLLNSLDSIQDDLKRFEYVSFHAPSRREKLTEVKFIERLQSVAERDWAIIVHPNLIENFSLWQKLGKSVCIENMDRRKKTGRTAEELRRFFEELPDASFCFDIGHARQVDPTMQEAELMLMRFGDRLQQVHMSYVNSQSRHERLNYESIISFQRVARLIRETVPVILESPVDKKSIEDEIFSAEKALSRTITPAMI